MGTSANIGALKIDISASVASFKKAIDTTKKSLGSLASAANKSIPVMAKTFAAVTVAATAAGAAISAISLSKIADAKELENVSKTLGISTESYQVMAGAAKKFGIEQDKVKDILKDSGEKMAEYYQTGGGGYKDFMEQVAKPAGVDIQDLINLPPEEQLKTVVKLMDDAGLSAQQQSFYMESIASDATYLLPMFKDNAAELDKMRAHMQATGQIMSGTVVTALAKTKTNMEGVGGVMRGWGTILVSGFAPQLEALTAKLFEILTTNETIRTAFATLGTSIGSALSSITTALSPIINAVTYILTHTREIIALGAATALVWGGSVAFAMIAAATATGVLTAAMVALKFAIAATGVGLLIVGLAALIVKIWEWSDSVGGVGNAFSIVGAVAQTVWDNIGNGATFIGSSLKSIALGIAADFISAFAQVKTAFANLMTMVEGGINKMITGINEALSFEGPWGISSKLDIGKVDFAGEYEKSANEAERLATNLENGSKAAAQAAQAAKSEIVSMGDALSRATNVYGDSPEKRTRAAKGEDQGAKPVITPTTTTTGAVAPAGGAGGGGGGAEAATKEEQALTALEERVASLRETQGMSALQEAIYNEQKKIGTAASQEYVAQLVTEEYQINKMKEAAEEYKNMFKDAFTSIIDGSKSVKEAFADMLSNMASKLAEQAFDSLWEQVLPSLGGGTGGGGVWGAIKGVFGWADGGYTGNGGKYQPAGIVHAGEYVMSAAAVRNIGVGNLEAMHNNAKRGYATGGLVGGRVGLNSASAGVRRLESSDRPPVIVNVANSDDFKIGIIGEANRNASGIVKTGITNYDKRQAPLTQSRINNHPRRR